MDNVSEAERGQATAVPPKNDIGERRPSTKSFELPPFDDTDSVARARNRKFSSTYVAKEAESYKGWAYAAVLQSLSENLSHQRRFGTLWHRLLLHDQSKITRTERILAHLDRKDKYGPGYRIPNEDLEELHHLLSPSCCLHCTQRLRPDSQRTSQHTGSDESTPDPIPNTHTEQPSEAELSEIREGLLDTIFPRLKRYSESLILMNQIDKLPHTGYWEWNSVKTTMEKEGLMKDEDTDWDFMRFQDDFLSTRAENINRYFSALVYGDSGFAMLFRWIFKDRGRTKTKGDTAQYVSTMWMRSFKRALVATLVGVVMLAPVGILLLKPLDQGKSFVVVICFSAAFLLVLLLLHKKLDAILVSFSAYMAVLVTFLANLQTPGN